MLGNKFYLESDEADLIWSFGIRKQKCWMCDLFHDSIEQDGERWYLPVEIFEDELVVIHLEQLIGREVNIEFDTIDMSGNKGREILRLLLTQAAYERTSDVLEEEKDTEDVDEEMVEVAVTLVFPENQSPAIIESSDEDIWPDEI